MSIERNMKRALRGWVVNRHIIYDRSVNAVFEVRSTSFDHLNEDQDEQRYDWKIKTINNINVGIPFWFWLKPNDDIKIKTFNNHGLWLLTEK